VPYRAAPRACSMSEVLCVLRTKLTIRPEVLRRKAPGSAGSITACDMAAAVARNRGRKRSRISLRVVRVEWVLKPGDELAATADERHRDGG
jgi:hypothetical protein